MTSQLHIAVAGAAGRMGQRILSLARDMPDVRIVDALTHAHDPDLGRDAGEVAGFGHLGVPLTVEMDFEPMPHVLIDFSKPEGTRHWLSVCHHRKLPIVIGTTGLTPADHRAIDEAALKIPVLQATNTSMGVAVLNAIGAMMARMLGDSFDIEITEIHHRHKKDAPSGTALTLADRILEATGRPKSKLVFGRNPDSEPHHSGDIGVHSLRMGDVTGTHTLHFAGEGERLELTHIATHRDVFARGALRAAAWLAGRGAGRYRIEDVLGIDR
jgi:4-hydroxy-tetrahydrodipicolinate reductase